MIDLEEIRKNKPMSELLKFSTINLDKPTGPTSFQTAEMAGRILGIKKFSHFGTLDPLVTGVLPIALNRACKLTGWFMKKNKPMLE
jgi:Pseudouridine synthase